MVMFKAKFKPASDKPGAGDRQAGDKPRASQQQQRPQPVPPTENDRDEDKEKAPPIEKERGPQYPVKEPGPGEPPARV